MLAIPVDESISKKDRKARKKRTGKPLNVDILKKVRGELLGYNARELQRAESMNSIKFPKRINHPDDFLVRVPKKVRLGWNKGSQPDLLDFEQYKKTQAGENEAEVYDEREWVRGIWETWFDEVIPQLDGTGGR